MSSSIKYLDHFGTIPYDFTGKGGYAIATDITKFIALSDKSSATYYNLYNISDGIRPDQVSYELYGSAKYYWMLFLMNDELRNGMSGWPMSDREMDLMIEDEYDTKAFLSSNLQDECECEEEPLYRIPFGDEYNSGLRIVYESDTTPTTIESTGYRIAKYDANRVGLILDSTNATSLDRNIVFSGLDSQHMWISHDQSPEGLAWGALVDELNLENVPCTFDGYEATSIELGHRQIMSYDLLRNATYQYFIPGTIETDNEDVSVSHFDVLNDTEELLDPTRITFNDYEIITNNRRKTIRVPHPSIVNQLEAEYINLIRN
jgi:hypothetical protein